VDVMRLGVTRIGATQTKPILDDFRARKAMAGGTAAIDEGKAGGGAGVAGASAGERAPTTAGAGEGSY
jgi:hypothetical protein